MKIKGHSKIELRDAKTGIITDVREQDNFVTEFPSELFKQMGYWRPNAFTSRENNPIDDLFGGIMCFNEAINENADMTGRHPSPLYAPASKTMTANGSVIVTDNRAPSEMGQYNANESLASDGFVRRYVYDWDTNEGNGTIASVCLSSKYGGYIGTGNSSSRTADRTTKTFEPIENALASADPKFPTCFTRDTRPMYINWSDNVVGVLQGLDVSQGVMVIAEYDATAVSINPFKNLNDVKNSRKVREVTYNFNPINDSVAYIMSFSHYGYFGLVLFNANPNSSSVVTNVLKFNLDNTQEQYRFTNLGPLGYNFQHFGTFAFLPGYFISCDTSLSYESRDSYIKAINISSGVVTNLGTIIYSGASFMSGPIIQLEDRIFTPGTCIKVVNGSIVSEPINGYNHTRTTSGNGIVHSSPIDGQVFGGQAVDNPYIIFSGGQNFDVNEFSFVVDGTLFRPYLATISNLQDPVIKTADKTMKITYTLTLLEQN